MRDILFYKLIKNLNSLTKLQLSKNKFFVTNYTLSTLKKWKFLSKISKIVF